MDLSQSTIAVAGGLGIWLLAIAIFDIKTFRIPNAASFPLMFAGLIFAEWCGDGRMMGHVVGAAVGYFSLALVGEAFFRLRAEEGLGLGDAKLFGAAGAWLGWQALPFVLLIASLSGLVQALATGRGKGLHRRLAFGPHIAAGFWLTWMFGAPGMPPVWR